MQLFNDLPQSSELLAATKEIFSARIAQRAAPGIFFSLFDTAGIICEVGLGDAGTAGSPPHPRSRFRIASCSKSFTAAAVLLLRDRGELALDEPITKYVPSLFPTMPVGHPEAPTLRMLLSMAGGLPTDDPWADRQESLSSAEFDTILQRGVRFAATPGTRYEYSNLGYALLGRVIEVVGGRSYPDFVTQNLLLPLGLNETVFDPADVQSDRMATGFRKTETGWQALPFTGPGAFTAIGGIVTTSSDLARWAGWLGAALRPDNTCQAVLSAASRREMQAIQTVIDFSPREEACITGYGYGLVIEQHSRHGLVVSHSGGYPGFSSHMRWSARTGLGVVAFENATYSGAWDPAVSALERVLDAALGESLPDTPPSSEIERLGEGLRRLVVEGWDDAVADAILLENVALDKPYPEWALEFAEIKREAGVIDIQGIKLLPRDPGGADNGFGRFDLELPCSKGSIVIKAECGPPQPMKIQSIKLNLMIRS